MNACKVLISPSRRQDLVVKPFDKGRGMCFLNVKDEGERQLSGHTVRNWGRTWLAKCLKRSLNQHATYIWTALCQKKYTSFSAPTTTIKQNRKPMPFTEYPYKKAQGATRFVGWPTDLEEMRGPNSTISKYIEYFLLPTVRQQSTYMGLDASAR